METSLTGALDEAAKAPLGVWGRNDSIIGNTGGRDPNRHAGELLSKILRQFKPKRLIDLVNFCAIFNR